MGLESSDDAGVVRISDELALVQTVDFFTPVVDDPYLFGRIAASNALSDIYAMGAQPLTALNIVCFPVGEIGPETLGAILEGGADTLAEAGVLLLGGHSVDDPEPKYGMAVTGTVHPRHIATNAQAAVGDFVVLTKPLGTGVVTTAAKQESCPGPVLDAACQSMVQLNAAAARAIRAVGIPDTVHTVTDITGFGLLGHLLHWVRAAGVSIELDSDAIPLLPGAWELCAAGFTTGGGAANLRHVAPHLDVGPDVEPVMLALLSDPQTSGGLCIAVDPDGKDRLLEALQQNGVEVRAVIGRVAEGPARIRVR